MSRILLVFAGLCVTFSAFAGEAPQGARKPVRCPEPSRFKDQIYNCGQNGFAVKVAKACELALTREGESVGRALSDEIRKLNRELDSAQEASLEIGRAHV